MLFSLVPLFFITGYSLKSYERAASLELSQRLSGNSRELSVIFGDFASNLDQIIRKHAADPLLISYLAQNSVKNIQQQVMAWMSSHFVSRLSVFNQDGRLVAAVARSLQGEPILQKGVENANIFLADAYLEKIGKRPLWYNLDMSAEGQVELIVFRRILSANLRTVGFLEEIIVLDESFLKSLAKRMNLDFFVLGPTAKVLVASHPDLLLYPAGFFAEWQKPDGERYFEFNIRGVPQGAMMSQMKWGDASFWLGIVASKKGSLDILANVRETFSVVVFVVIVLLLLATVLVTRNFLKPLSDLVTAIRTMDRGEVAVEIPVTSQNEIGLLTESFNEMSRRVSEARDDLKQKIQELEAANRQIRETQAKLVHSAKMVSLGQLVAGIAHELNNPIGYISSNMVHLQDYAEKLIKLVEVAEQDPKKLKKSKEQLEYDYIVEDLPKLIRSCQEGARRTKDIVTGLRNFSRLEEAKLKEVDVHDGIENTLSLLSGELKSRIRVHRQFQALPKIKCYASELNQVFMNLLANAAQAIDGDGDIWIRTAQMTVQEQPGIEIEIRDSGVGMDESVAEKIFDPFFTTKGVGQGTGLGLSISYGVIKKHGGEITVNSQPGRGTTFLIHLPLNPPQV